MAIAMLATALLGVVLLLILRAYYGGQEISYLKSNARSISSSLGILVEVGAGADVLRAQVRTLGFLSQTRVRVLDRDGVELADSGDPRRLNETVTISFGLEVGGFSETVTQTEEGTSLEQQFSSKIEVGDSPEDGSGRVQVTQKVIVSGDGAEEELGLGSLIPGVGPRLGLPEDIMSGPRSDRKVREPIVGPLGNVIGEVELSESPAIGRDVLNSVAWGWVISGAVAVTLAAGAGWLISRRLSTPLLDLADVTALMADGDLSVRSDLDRRDELGRLANSFNFMASRLEETVSTLRHFVADAAHQLSTPLSALRTNIELAASEPDDATRRKLIERAAVEVSRLDSLSSGLLDLSRIESGASGGHTSMVDLGGLARGISERYASQAEQAGVSFSLAVGSSPLPVRGDGGQLRMVLENLLDNAIKFTPEGGEVSFDVERSGEWADVTVADSGIGIPEEDLPRLFDRFHRGRNASSYSGNGLGLAIVKAIVEGHGGSVEAERTARGSRFVVRLPAVPPL